MAVGNDERRMPNDERMSKPRRSKLKHRQQVFASGFLTRIAGTFANFNKSKLSRLKPRMNASASFPFSIGFRLSVFGFPSSFGIRHWSFECPRASQTPLFSQ